MEYDFLKTQILDLQDTVMQIGQVMQMIEKALQEDASILVITWFHGAVRNKIPFLYLLQRQNILLQEVVALNCYG